MPTVVSQIEHQGVQNLVSAAAPMLHASDIGPTTQTTIKDHPSSGNSLSRPNTVSGISSKEPLPKQHLRPETPTFKQSMSDGAVISVPSTGFDTTDEPGYHLDASKELATSLRMYANDSDEEEVDSLKGKYQ